jgi:p-hydroxybenzoate 3-monooxygenase
MSESSIPLRTQVGIVGGGPSGLMLGHLLDRRGIDAVVLERRSAEHVIERVRAGVLEQGTVDLLDGAGLGDRLRREGMRHEGLYIAFAGTRHRIDLAGLTGGRAITIYGQNEIVRDLIDARRARGTPLLFDVQPLSVHDLDTGRPRIRFGDRGTSRELACDIIAGCDGFHGACRGAIPPAALQTFHWTYPFGWLGVLAEAAPTSDELVYSRHDRGFALFSMRTPAVTRLYLQCAPDEDIRDWPDDRIWTELRTRLQTGDGWTPREGPILQKGVTGMRSFVAEPMRYGRLLLAGDAAHIVPPTGAKGLNLAMADVTLLCDALDEFFARGSTRALDDYSARALRRAWQAQRFSGWMTSLLHRDTQQTPFESRRQLAELDYLVSSRSAMTSLAESYTGTPFE